MQHAGPWTFGLYTVHRVIFKQEFTSKHGTVSRLKSVESIPHSQMQQGTVGCIQLAACSIV